MTQTKAQNSFGVRRTLANQFDHIALALRDNDMDMFEVWVNRANGYLDRHSDDVIDAAFSR